MAITSYAHPQGARQLGLASGATRSSKPLVVDGDVDVDAEIKVTREAVVLAGIATGVIICLGAGC